MKQVLGRRSSVVGRFGLTMLLCGTAAAQTFYIPAHVKWHKAPVNPTEQYAQTTVYVVWPGQLGERRLFGRADCTLLKEGRAIRVSKGDARDLYLGWTRVKVYTDGGYDADYRLVFSTVAKATDSIPGRPKHVEGIQGGLRFDHGLVVNRKVYLPVQIENGSELLRELESYKANADSH